jgi:hypothetical protein
MSTQAKAQVSVGVHNLVLYRRALHPELLPVKARRALSHGYYELEAWLMPSGHAVRFQHRGLILTELVTDREGGLPTTGVVTTFPCQGEKDHEHAFKDSGVNYITSMQTENLSENLYRATYQEMQALAEEVDGLLVQWTGPDGGRNLSMLDIQRASKECHCQSFHLIAATGLVLRTQTIFEHS